MLNSMIEANCLQTFDATDLMPNVELFHNTLIKEYETQRHFIDDDNLVEVSYSELVDNPLETIRKIYDVLGLNGFEDSKKAFVDYIEEQSQYRPHTYATSTTNQ